MTAYWPRPTGPNRDLVVVAPTGHILAGVAHTTPDGTEISRVTVERQGPHGRPFVRYAGAHGSTDMSCAPLRAIIALTGATTDPYTERRILELLIRDLPTPETTADDDPAARLVAYTHPLLTYIATHADPAPAAVTEMPRNVSDAYRHADVPSLLEAVGVAANRQTVRETHQALTIDGTHNYRFVSFLPALDGLEGNLAANVIRSFADAADTVPLDATVHPGLARDAIGLLAQTRQGTNDRRRHDTLRELARRTDGHAQLAIFGRAAPLQRFDPTGLKASNFAQFAARAREAANLLEQPPTVRMLTGRPIPGVTPPMRLRVLTRNNRADLAWAGQDMNNCLGDWAVGGRFATMFGADDVIVLAVDNTGTHHAAIHIREERQAGERYGPRNSPVRQDLHNAIAQMLRPYGIDLNREHHDPPPF